MKNSILLVLLSSFSFAAFAQDDEMSDFTPAAAIKWNAASLSFGKLSLGSEYNYRHGKSFTFNVGIPVGKTLKATVNNETRSLKIKATSVMGGYRLYMGKKPMSGFYFEPYLKYGKVSFETNTNFTLNGTDRNFDVTGSVGGVGLGAQLGVQFLISNVVVIDWFLVGPEATSSTFRFEAQETGNGPAWDTGASADAQQEILDFINSIPIIGNKAGIEVNSSARNVKAHYNGFLPGFRTGVSIGIRF